MMGSDLAALKRYLKSKGIPSSGIKLVRDGLADEMNIKKARQFCFTEENHRTIFCAHALDWLPREARVGILLHECFHIIGHCFNEYAEICVDDNVMSHVPESGYHYRDVEYIGHLGRVRKAKAIECVSKAFLRRLDQ